jgi:serine/threonine-protein kinase
MPDGLDEETISVRKIGKYQITGELGRGGMGRVFKVMHPEIPRILAVKAFAPHPFLISAVGKEELLLMFREEACKMASLSHPNLASVEDFSFAPEPYYTMAYHPRSLGLLMGEKGDPESPCRKLDPDSAIHFLRELLNALHCLHFYGMIHRDVKPWNLLLNDADTLILGDFGLSRLRHEVTRTPTNIKVGSPGYAAPEQEKNADSADERSDLYSAGVVFYRMLTGHFPEKKRMEKELPQPVDLWMSFLGPALDSDPEKRHENAKGMLRALEIVASDWTEFKEKECLFFPFRGKPLQAPEGIIGLRNTPLRTGVVGNPALSLDADSLFSPARSFLNRFMEACDPAVVRDETTGLLWEKSGSPFPVNRAGAEDWIRAANTRAMGGERNWRFPTVPELFSLVGDTSADRPRCQQSPMDPRQAWIWSADTRSHISAWFVDLVRGFTAPMDRDGRCFTRAVCGPSS